MTDDTYVAGLRMLARREFSEAQVRQRLARRGHPADAIDTAIERLKADRSLDDARTAGAIARHETRVRGHGKLRVKQRLEAAGLAPAIVERALNEAFGDLDPDALLAAALARRLRGRNGIIDQGEFRRLYRALIARGFEGDRVLALLKRHRGGADDE